PISLLGASVSAAGGAVVTVASFLLFFGAAADYLLFFSQPFLPTALRPVICSLLELGRGCAEFAACRNGAPLFGMLGTAWSVGFSGLSVIFQNLDRAGTARPSFFAFLIKRAMFGLVMAFLLFLSEIG
ncbi:MAG: hypothetical protein KBS76_00285, partial [Ruminococcus sp.]|nr:hypothetical protein [Candidatus Apopatosoma intestinale]